MNAQENWKAYKQIPWITFNPRVGTTNDKGWVAHLISDLGNTKISYFDHDWQLVKEIPTKQHWKGNKISKWLAVPTGAYVHRLVAEHFIPNLNGSRFVAHVDNDKTNNAFWNLVWVDQAKRSTIEKRIHTL